jgi:dTDP-4-amino-4,6-dideoxygalactose transaminase
VTASTLALDGGVAVRTEPFPPTNTVGDEERAAVLDVLESGSLSQFLGVWGDEFLGGKWVRRCEELLAGRLGAAHAVSVNSATTALQVALAAVGVEPGDEVIVPPYTMSATAASVVLQNAIPVFADIEDETYGLDPKSVEERITPHTTAIVVVHLFGHPARLGELTALAERHGLRLIEDAAQSLGATWKGRETGTIGDAGVISLNRHKIIQSGEGGAVVTDDPRIAQVAQLVRNHGEVVVANTELPTIANTVGSNFRLSELHAAVAAAQLGKLDDLLHVRQELGARLGARLAQLPGLRPGMPAEGCTHGYYLFPVRIDAGELGVSRATFARALRAEGAPATEGYVEPIYLQPLYQQRIAHGTRGCPWTCGHWRGEVSYERGICPVTERLYESDLLLLDVCRSPLTPRDVDDVADAFEKVIENLDRLRALDAQ